MLSSVVFIFILGGVSAVNISCNSSPISKEIERKNFFLMKCVETNSKFLEMKKCWITQVTLKREEAVDGASSLFKFCRKRSCTSSLTTRRTGIYSKQFYISCYFYTYFLYGIICKQLCS